MSNSKPDTLPSNESTPPADLLAELRWTSNRGDLAQIYLRHLCQRAASEIADLRQFKEWAEPQCQDYAANRMEIERAQRIMRRAVSWLQIKEVAFATHKGKAIIEEMQRFLVGAATETGAGNQPDPYVSGLAQAGIRAERDRRIIERHVRWHDEALRLLEQVNTGYEGEWPEIADFVRRSTTRIEQSSSEKAGACPDPNCIDGYIPSQPDGEPVACPRRHPLSKSEVSK